MWKKHEELHKFHSFLPVTVFLRLWFFLAGFRLTLGTSCLYDLLRRAERRFPAEAVAEHNSCFFLFFIFDMAHFSFVSLKCFERRKRENFLLVNLIDLSTLSRFDLDSPRSLIRAQMAARVKIDPRCRSVVISDFFIKLFSFSFLSIEARIVTWNVFNQFT